jgi:hypothetical protein
MGAGYKNQSTIAWFRLAETVSKGEKERALTLYRLFSYSFVDQAFAAQLEADILGAFDDERAFDRYVESIVAYKKDGRDALVVQISETVVLFAFCRSLYDKIKYFLTSSILDTSMRAHVCRRVVMHVCMDTNPFIQDLFSEAEYTCIQKLILYGCDGTEDNHERILFLQWLDTYDQKKCVLSTCVKAPARECRKAA